LEARFTIWREAKVDLNAGVFDTAKAAKQRVSLAIALSEC
jgi:hypothetical protein